MSVGDEKGLRMFLKISDYKIWGGKIPALSAEAASLGLTFLPIFILHHFKVK